MAKKEKKAVVAASAGIVKPFIIAAVVVVVFVSMALLYLSQKDAKIRQADLAKVGEQAEVAGICENSIKSVLDANVGAARVYDANGTLLFSLRANNGVEGIENLPPQLASVIQTKLLNGADVAVSKIDLDAWSQGHTVLGGITEKRTMEELTKGSLGFVAVEAFCGYTKTMLSEDAKFIVAARLDQAFTAEQLVAYCASVGDFDGVRGAVAASEQWFNKSLDKLNENQLAYLGYTFGSQDCGWEDFAEKYPNNTGGAEKPEDFGFWQTGGDTYWLLRQKVSQELDSIVGEKLLTEDFNVKIELDSALQGKLQQTLDEQLKPSITLDADGQTVIDGVVGVVDSHTGFVTALIGGRSVNNLAREFKLNHVSMLGNLTEAGVQFEKDPTLTFASLLPYESAAGTIDYAPFIELVQFDQMSVVGMTPTVEPNCTLDELLNFGTGLYLDGTFRFISQVQNSSGDVVYKAEPLINVSAQSPNPDIRSLLLASTEGTKVNYSLCNEVGCVFGEFSSEYVIGSIVGTDVTGYSMSYEDSDLCATSQLALARVVQAHYPKQAESIDSEGLVAKKIAAVQDSNANVVAGAVEEWAAELQEMPITSVGSRSMFEQMYQQYSLQLASYQGLLSKETFVDLQKKLDAVRISRSEELMKYIA